MINTRERILDAAADAFAAKGFRSSTVSKIASDAEVNIITLYRYFPKKADLYWDAVDRRLRRSNHSECLIEAIKKAESPGELVPRLTVEISGILNAEPTLGRLIHFVALELDRERRLMVQLHFRPIFELLALRISLWAKAGIIRSVDPTDAAWAIVGVLLVNSGIRELLGDVGARTQSTYGFADICLDGLAVSSVRNL